MTIDPTELAARLESHMGKQDVGVLLVDCRKAAKVILAQAAPIEALETERDQWKAIAKQAVNSGLHLTGILI